MGEGTTLHPPPTPSNPGLNHFNQDSNIPNTNRSSIAKLDIMPSKVTVVAIHNTDNRILDNIPKVATASRAITKAMGNKVSITNLKLTNHHKYNSNKEYR